MDKKKAVLCQKKAAINFFEADNHFENTEKVLIKYQMYRRED